MAHSADTAQTPRIREPVEQSSIACTHRDGYMCGLQTLTAICVTVPQLLAAGGVSWLVLALGRKKMGSLWKEPAVSSGQV